MKSYLRILCTNRSWKLPLICDDNCDHCTVRYYCWTLKKHSLTIVEMLEQENATEFVLGANGGEMPMDEFKNITEGNLNESTKSEVP